MLLATLLALGAAVIHAGWNFIAKRATGDRYMVLWAQFFMGGLICLPLAIGNHVLFGMPGTAYMFAAFSGVIHVPYLWLLAKAYTLGDFSVSYPVARGGGAALAAIGGVLFLSDQLTTWHVAGIVVIVGGLSILAIGATGRNLVIALSVSLAVGTYSVFDAAGARTKRDTIGYIFITMVTGAASNTLFGLSTGRYADMVAVMRARWRTAIVTGIASTVTYGMVLVATQYAPLGYVTALRESSVVLAALIGWKYLGEGDHRRRISAAGIVTCGILLMVLGRG
ncbi:MAG TPA: EamA family transporter [Ilumatobacteraceae bacterium]|nr:EamA family transporter [Ilumatobacteraceae bacterium]HRB04371.1 EamA family transporter [Ilumatobacteraceae bacterium]